METTKQTTRSWNEMRMDGSTRSITSLRSVFEDGSTLETFVSVDDENEVRRWNVRTYVDGDEVKVETRNSDGELCRSKSFPVSQREEMLRDIGDGATVTFDGVHTWISNGAIVPIQCLETAGIEVTDAHRDALDRELDEIVARRRAARASMTDADRAEERAEMLAAFGPGETVIDVLTGERFEL